MSGDHTCARLAAHASAALALAALVYASLSVESDSGGDADGGR